MKKIAAISVVAAALVVPTAPASATNIEPAQANTPSAAPTAAIETEVAPAAARASSSVPRATKFVSPLKFGKYRLTSAQGARCIPVVGGSTFHEGQDMGATNNDPIYAVTDGVVKRTSHGTNNASGYIVVETNIGGRRYDFVYVHMWNATTHVKVGQKVKAGQQISRVGNSGPSTAPHLHLEVWDGSWYTTKSLDPVEFLKKHGLNLERGATYVNKTKAPSSCNYRINKYSDLKASASVSSKTIKSVPANKIVTSKPGTLINGMVPIRADGVNGWVNRYSISPYYGPAPKDPTPPAQSSTQYHSKKVTKGVYEATSNVNLRSQAPSGSVLVTVPKGKEVSATGRTGADGSWYQVAYGKTNGWIKGGYLKLKHASALPSTSEKPKPVTGTDNSLKNKKMTVKSPLNLRDKASTGKVIATMPAKAAVTLTGKTDVKGSWVQLKYGSKTGWASKKYLTEVSTPKPPVAKPPAAKPQTGSMSTKVTLNLRDKAKTGKVIATMPAKALVKLTGKTAEKGTWVQVKYGSKTGWASKQYLSTAAASKPPTVKPPASKPQTASMSTKANLNLRDKAKTGRVIATMPKGAKVTTTGKTAESGRWVQVKYGSKTGWADKSYLQAANSKPAAKTKVTRSALNMRAESNAGSRIVTTLKQGARVEVIGAPTKNGWVKIKSGSKTGYVNGAYLK